MRPRKSRRADQNSITLSTSQAVREDYGYGVNAWTGHSMPSGRSSVGDTLSGGSIPGRSQRAPAESALVGRLAGPGFDPWWRRSRGGTATRLGADVSYWQQPDRLSVAAAPRCFLAKHRDDSAENVTVATRQAMRYPRTEPIGRARASTPFAALPLN